MRTFIKNNYLGIILLTTLFFITYNRATGQQLSILKAERFGDSGWDFINDVLKLQNGDYIYCGSISGSIYGDTLGFNTKSNINAWVAFADSIGNIIKQKDYNNNGFDTFTSMASLGNNILLSGIFQDTLLLDSILLIGTAHSNGFLAISNTNGDILNAARVSFADSYISNMRLAGCFSETYFLAGIYKDTIQLSSIQSPGSTGFFLSRVNSSFEVQLPIYLKATGNIELGGLSCNDSSVVVAGTFSDTLVIGDTCLISLGHSDAFIARFGLGLQLQHLETISSPEEIDIKCVVLNNKNQIAIAGSFKGSAIICDTLLTGQGNFDIMAAVWDSTGNLKWVNTAGSIGNDYGWSIATGNEEDFFVSGSYTHILAIPDENGDMIELQPNSFFGNTFIAKYDRGGILKATINLPGTSEDFVSKLIINNDNTISASGNFFETLLLTSNDSTSFTVESAGSKDIFTILLKDMCSGYTIDAGPAINLCPGESLMLMPDFPCSGYLWQPDGILNTPLEVTQPGAYLLMAMDFYGCMAYDTLFIEQVPEPIVFAGNDTIVQAGSPLSLSGLIEFGQNPLWSTSGEGYFSTSADLETTYYFSNNDISNNSLWIILSTEIECGVVSDSLKVDILVEDDGITAFPNPTNGIVTLVREETQPMNNITITMQSGFILEQSIPVNSFEFSYNLQNLPPGTYLFYITTEAGTSCKAIIKS